MESDLLTVTEVAAILRRPAGTLRQWRHYGRGPKGFRVGGRVMYRRGEVNRWLAEQERAPQTRWAG